MGRLIPAGTGMKYYRNVKVDYDPTENQKQEDEFDEMASMTGGIDIPVLAGVPGVDTGDDFGDDAGDDLAVDDSEEEFDIDEAMKIDLDDDDDI